MSKENITTPAKLYNSFTPKPTYIHDYKLAVKYEGNCLKQNKVFLSHGNVVNVFIVYQLDTWSHDINTYFALKYCLFRSVKLNKNTDPDKHIYSGQGIGYDSR